MRVHILLLSLLVLIVALVSVFFSRDLLARTAEYLPELAATVLAGAAGYLVANLTQPSHPRDTESEHGPDRVPGTLAVDEGSLTNQLVVSFAKQILATASTEDLLQTIESRLSQLLSGRRVWLVGDAQRSDGDAAPPGRRPGQMFNDAVQEWTTFLINLDGRPQGMLGVESSGGLSADAKHTIHALLPLIAQSLRTAQDIKTLRDASVVDLLTGAATRREGLRRVNAEVKRAQRTGSTMAVLMMDLDHFKSINDQFGHSVGDSLLTAIGQTLARTLRASDIRCRWGGEEFLIVLPDTPLPQAQVAAANLLHSVAATTTPSARGPVSSTASIGITIARPAETNVDRIVERADLALYQAKDAGRGCVRVVLGGFDGEPIGVKPTPNSATTASKLPFPDRRNPARPDRRTTRARGRRSSDVAADAGPQPPDTPPAPERRRVASL